MTYTYAQHASGEFSVDVMPGTKHCGINDNRGQFRYQVDIDYTGSALDETGFLLDNTDFQRYFQALEPLSISCELFARRCAQHFADCLQSRIDSVRRVAVRIYPFGDVYVESIITNEVTA